MIIIINVKKKNGMIDMYVVLNIKLYMNINVCFEKVL